jgi:putative pyruvate formate lyase activating enzyme
MICSRRRFLEELASASALATVSLTGCPKDRSQPEPTTLPEPTMSARTEPVPPATFEPAYLKLEREGKLEARQKQLWRILRKCRLCPRRCEANRLAGELGVCRAGGQARVDSAAPHHGEEPPLVGNKGSGTIFFSHCNLRCCFCQNWQIAHRGDGEDIDHVELAGLMLGLQTRGCRNINLVTPTHMVPQIIGALRIAIRHGLRLPLVYNTGGYDSLEVVKLLDGIVDIYMPDFKFQDPATARRFCSEADKYPESAAAAIEEMHRQVGVLQTNQRGIATRGVILRHLVMPNNLAGTDRFVRWVANKLSPRTYVNLMAQYRPEHRAFEYPEIARRPTSQEWKQALSWTKAAGLTNLARG